MSFEAYRCCANINGYELLYRYGASGTDLRDQQGRSGSMKSTVSDNYFVIITNGQSRPNVMSLSYLMYFI